MCQPKDCDFKEKCYRFTAKPSELQSYADFSNKKPCEYFWEDTKEEKTMRNIDNISHC